jgi:hypothetical protein
MHLALGLVPVAGTVVYAALVAAMMEAHTAIVRRALVQFLRLTPVGGNTAASRVGAGYGDEWAAEPLA